MTTAENVFAPPEVTGETVVRELEGIGTLRFENHGPGEWLTQKGEPAKTSRRRYLLDDQDLDSVSSIVGTLDKPALYHWHEDHGVRGGVAAERMGELQNVPEEDMLKRVRSLGLGASAKRDEGADRGTVIHAAMHALATTGMAPNPTGFPPHARPWLRGAIRAWVRFDVAEIVEVEQIVCHPELGYAGRPDLVYRAGDGIVTLADYKTGKGRVFEQAHYQTRLYAMALRASLGIDVDAIEMVGIGDDGGFEIVQCEVSERDALDLLAVYRSRKRVNAGMAGQRAVARKALAT